jgi:hypothetical protein
LSGTIAALRFFFTQTLDLTDLSRKRRLTWLNFQ